MKKYFYISSFALLGFLLQLLLRSAIELAYVRYNFAITLRMLCSLPNAEFARIHHAIIVGTAAAGIIFGFLMGKYFWPFLYDESGHLRKDVLLRWGK